MVCFYNLEFFSVSINKMIVVFVCQAKGEQNEMKNEQKNAASKGKSD